MIGILLARKDLSEMLRDEEFQLWVGVLILTLLGAAVIFAWLDRWKKRRAKEEETDVGTLTSYRLMFERGELSQEEYEKIRNRIADKMKGKPSLPLPKVKPPEPSPPASGESSGNSA